MYTPPVIRPGQLLAFTLLEDTEIVDTNEPVWLCAAAFSDKDRLPTQPPNTRGKLVRYTSDGVAFGKCVGITEDVYIHKSVLMKCNEDLVEGVRRGGGIFHLIGLSHSSLFSWGLSRCFHGTKIPRLC